jgi:hypothetical protein
MYVVVEQPALGRFPVVLGINGVGEFGGVGAEQLMKPVPAWNVFCEQVRPGQLGQREACLVRASPR